MKVEVSIPTENDDVIPHIAEVTLRSHWHRNNRHNGLVVVIVAGVKVTVPVQELRNAINCVTWD